MSTTPIFYLVFANSSEKKMLKLEREEDAIRNLLKPVEKEERIKVAVQSFASIKKSWAFFA